MLSAVPAFGVGEPSAPASRDAAPSVVDDVMEWWRCFRFPRGTFFGPAPLMSFIHYIGRVCMSVRRCWSPPGADDETYLERALLVSVLASRAGPGLVISGALAEGVAAHPRATALVAAGELCATTGDADVPR